MRPKTIHNEITAQGLGLHTGQNITVRLKPAPVNSGVIFQRTDLFNAPPLAANPTNVTNTVLATTLGRGENHLSTIEHLMAALAGLGVDNLLIEVDGPELPIFDGSAAEWVHLLNLAGLTKQDAVRPIYLVDRPHRFSLGDKSIEVRPAARFAVEAHINFDGLIGRQCFYYLASEETFTTEISRTRTFCLAQDVEKMRNQGLALGGSLDNAVVVGDDGILNPEGLRFPDEFVRHKILDFIGDLALAGAPIIGQFILHKPGHELNRCFLLEALTKKIFKPILAAKSNPAVKAKTHFTPPARLMLLDETWTAI
ncbi:MAG: UDP-3-O-acyl-N-acetylglucosamine deacetylase [Candidatus Adiutrix intracellularis]|jgi:UDP-3-O-[3-hydroxymyristoyl] N-acetylglucosamine deacetylase|nr:UDP-3-O-acyl-N-acetylglucosamine deacetylase [Candidatus Adiutrix intracellularis]